MILTSLHIDNYKNIPLADLQFSHNVNGFLGRNGMGKSNLLDAIHYMSIGKSHTGSTDADIVRRGETFAMVKAQYLRRGQPEELTLGLTEGKRKSFKRQGKEYRRMSQHIGAFPIVLVSPRDIDLVQGPAEERRRFIDMIIAQTDPIYLDRLIRYNEALKQRNRLLRDGVADTALLDAVEMAMAPAAAYITAVRRDTIEKFAEIFSRHYADIAQSGEEPRARYVSKLLAEGKDLGDLLAANRARDMAIGFTTAGPHRDDLELTLGGMAVRTSASQGQQKTFTIAMRLAQYEFLSRAVAMRPLLLLDDIFDKLDSRRVTNIVEVVSRDIFGQIFITDTNRDHLDSIMAATDADYRLWEVTDGAFTQISTTRQTQQP